MDQNWFATVALLSWPLVAIILFRSLPSGLAILWTIFGAQLLLPVNAVIKFQMIPQLDKNSVPNLCVFIACMILGSTRAVTLKFGIPTVLLSSYILMPIVTSLQNGDAIYIADRILPGVGLYDGLSAALTASITLIPFFLGRRLLRKSEDILNIFVVLVIGELIYTLPLLFEIRFSPQLHFWLYGYAPADFLQSVRGGGYRPMVFMGHGLLAALFLMTAAVAATTLWRTGTKIKRISNGVTTFYLTAILILSKSLAATIYAFFLMPLVAFSKPRFQLRIAAVLVSIALLYPMLRSFDLFPTQSVTEAANLVSTERSDSMQTRFDNETALLMRASQRPWLGWGRFGRSRVYDSSGKDVSLTDGEWIISMGQFGIVGFLSEFGLLAFGVFRAVNMIRSSDAPNDLIFLAALSLIVAVNILDLLPNSGLQPWTWLLSGALLGRCEALQSLERRGKTAARPSIIPYS
jgi:hypothetical protein